MKYLIVGLAMVSLGMRSVSDGGVVVQTVEPDSAAAKAGLVPGVIITEASGKPVAGHADFMAAVQNAPAGTQIKLKAGGKDLHVSAGRLGLAVRPDLPAEALGAYEQARKALEAKDYVAAADGFGAAAKACAKRPECAVWLYGNQAQALLAHRKGDLALAAFQAAREAIAGVGTPATKITVLRGMARVKAATGDMKGALELYTDAVEMSDTQGLALWAAEDRYASGNLCMGLEQFEKAQGLYGKALDGYQSVQPDSQGVASILNNLGVAAFNRNDLDVALAHHRRSLALRQKLAPEGLDVALSLRNIGLVCYQKADYGAAKENYEKALAIRDKLAAGTMAAAESHDDLGTVAMARGDRATAEREFSASLDIRQKLRPDGPEVAASYRNLVVLFTKYAEYAKAKEVGDKALGIYEKLSPNTLSHAAILNSMGALHRRLGLLDEAERFLTKALEIRARIVPGGPLVAETTNNLANVKMDRADFVGAEAQYLDARAIYEKISPNSRELAACLHNLGAVHDEMENYPKAQEYMDRARTILEEVAPNDPEMVSLLMDMAIIAQDTKNLDKAENNLRRALDLVRRIAPGSLLEAQALTNLGTVRRDQEDNEEALKVLTQAEQIAAKTAPRSLTHATALSNLAYARLAAGDRKTAIADFQASLTLLEAQRGTIRSTESKSLLLRTHARKYIGLVRAYAEDGNFALAMETAERSRARSLLDLLAERNVTADLPTDLRERLTRLDARQKVAYRDLVWIDPAKDAERAKLVDAEIVGIDNERKQLEDEIHRVSPKFASLQYPSPLDAASIQKLLDPGTLLLMYSVAAEQTYVFAVTKTELTGYTVKVNDQDLRAKITSVIEAFASAKNAVKLSSELYDLLVRPAQAEVDKAKRILVCPDGPINILPLQALAAKVEQTGAPEPAAEDQRGVAAVPDSVRVTYLADSKPVHTTPSMTVYAEFRAWAKSGNGQKTELLAYGYPTNTGQDVRSSRPSAYRDVNLDPLPGMEREVQEIAQPYGVQAVVRTKEQATETKFKGECDTARVIHLACHGLLEDRDPLASGVVLTPSSGDDGVLQAWEIFKLKTNADMVVLSACQTGLGKEVQSEGIVGLTRAFQYSGARSIVVSLWPVKDESTSALMKAFYAQLRGGSSKDEALQVAMKAVRETTEWNGKHVNWRSPHFWSPFILIGDRK